MNNFARISNLFFLIIVMLVSFTVEFASAEFLRTGSGIYQSTGKRAKVIISQEQPGLFILFGPPIELQVFNPAELSKDPSQSHAFIKFDPKVNRYTSLVIGTREFRISGGFTLNLGSIRVTVDNSNPYCSIVQEKGEGAGAEPEILGLLGLSVIVNNTGQQAVALLEANQFGEYRGIVNPYEMKEGNLFVGGKPLKTSVVGVSLEVKNPCLVPGAVVLSHESFEAARAAKGKDELKEILSEAVKQAKKRSPLVGLLKLRISPESIIVLDPIHGKVQVVKKVTLPSAPNSNVTVCSTEEVNFGA